MSRRRVVITGMGAVTPLGHSVESLYAAACAGKNGVARITNFDAHGFPTTFAAEVKDYDLRRFLPDAERWENSGVNTRFALGAAKQALEDSGLLDTAGVDRTRCGVYLGCGEGIHDFPHLVTTIARSYQSERRSMDAEAFFRHGMQLFNGPREKELEMHTTPAHLAETFDLEGPNYNCLTACAASSQAIGEATAIIRDGDADVMLSGGSHSMIHPLGVTGFNLLTALSQNNADPERASRPFDKTRNGFVLGEGSGMVVLEELEHAKKRGAPIYAEMVGYGSTGDAFRVTDSHDTGRGAIACMKAALKDSGLAADQIGYINAHGTSTQVNDRTESLAIKQVFGERAYQLPISASKSLMGHLIAAAGAAGLILTVQTILKGVIHPTINYETPDPDCDLDYVPNVAREAKIDHALTNAFGFGGQNISLIVSRFNN
jgi:3-oxoacyl-[acyl-carrier-protein] synthase II